MAIKQTTVKKRKPWTPAMLKEKAQNQKARKRRIETTERKYKRGERPGERKPRP